jgi:hypothetical protein
MADTVTQFASSAEQIAQFAGKNLAARVAELEFHFTSLRGDQIAARLTSHSIHGGLLNAAREVKRASAQIDVVLHVLGILVLLPSILEPDEVVESLSLGAGNAEARRFDLETDRRLAEFTFIDWKGNDNIRLQKVFKDFFRLAEFRTTKKKELWLNDDAFALKYFRSGASIRSATHKYRDVWESFQKAYPNFKTVGEYYRLRQGEVQLKVFDSDDNNKAI